MKSGVTVTVDRVDEINKILKGFKNDEVLVGIPEVKAPRTDKQEETELINNATILAINEFGSPINNIPSRHPMKTGIANAQEPIAEEFKKAALNAFTKGLKALEIYYNRAGIIASTSVKKVINAQEDMDPPSEATLKAREYAGFKGTKALIVTAQLRNAITYVVNRIF